MNTEKKGYDKVTYQCPAKIYSHEQRNNIIEEESVKSLNSTKLEGMIY